VDIVETALESSDRHPRFPTVMAIVAVYCRDFKLIICALTSQMVKPKQQKKYFSFGSLSAIAT